MRRVLVLAAFALVTGFDQPPPQRVFVSDETGNRVVVFDPVTKKVVASIDAGRRPRGIRLSPDGKSLYVAVSGSAIGGPGVDESKLPPADHAADGIAVIDTATLKVLRVLRAGTDPETFDVSPDGKTLFVSNEDASTVSAVDVAGKLHSRSGKVGDQPEGVAVTRDGRRVFVACEGADQVVMLDAATLKQRGAVTIAGRTRGLLASADGKFIYVTVEFGGKLGVLDAADGHLIRVVDLARGDDKLRPMGMAEAPDGKTLFVTTGRGGAVLEVDPSKGEIVRRIDGVGARLWGIARSGGSLVTANGPSGEISVIDRATGKVAARYKVGVGPWGVAAR
ncbi:beta-propeller fold lactonase family protein [Polymorphobacter sp. PAMC 29334]|uniref:beta-propeller fold lactonase family protein n=1 Tax=Polymorphobacter sp. PAMC 29334 TaxID=2862331 RepID=UPI001C77B4F5|nr:beta-propeller fold lactonase family protein [Polymorphobacter sp. PAMC 29334]QYE34891.1 beta-propeller fold lactonase family protein [Polymorphobacter sp. PAMC 29334]